MKNYPLYEHPNITNFRQLMEKNVNSIPNHEAFRYLDKKQVISVTYSQFYKDVFALGAYFLHMDLQDIKIAVIGENSYSWILTYFATVLSGNVIVPIDKELAETDIESLLLQCNAAVLVCSDSYSDVGTRMAQKNHIVVSLNMKDFPQYIQIGCHLMETNEVMPKQIITDEDAVCSIIFTSGTTGKSKGVMLTQKSLMTDAVSTCRNLYYAGPGMLTLPLHHAYAFTATVLMLLVHGQPICISRSIRTFNADMQIFKPQHITLVPLYAETLYDGIWKTAKKGGTEKRLKIMLAISNSLRRLGIDLRRVLFHSIIQQFGGNLELLVCGGAALKQSFIDGMDAFGVQVITGYGISECSPVVSANRNQFYRKDSIGLPLDCCEIKIQAGEICVKGPNVMVGYYDDEAATREVLVDGWFKTGDIGYQDADGFLFITGRKKNLIILSNGKNVSPEGENPNHICNFCKTVPVQYLPSPSVKLTYMALYVL